MAIERTADHRDLLTAPAGPSPRMAAYGVALVSSLVFIAVIPFVRTPLPRVDAFIPAYQSALIVSDLVTAVLLLGQLRVLASRGILALAAGYVFTALMAAAHTLSFPGLFTPSGLLGAGPDSTAWIYIFWHTGFPLAVIAYAISTRDPAAPGSLRAPAVPARRAVTIAVATAVAAACALTLLATAGRHLLPVITNGNQAAPQIVYVNYPVWACSFAALAVLWRRRPHSLLDMWLIAVMCAWVADVGLSTVFNPGRFTLGYYAGRLYGLAAANFVLVVLLLEISALYARLARSFEALGERTRELTAMNEELDAFTHTVAHDLRAPLVTIDGYAKMLIEDCGPVLDMDSRRRLGVVAGSARRMGQMIDGLLTFAKLGRQNVGVGRVNPADVARTAWAELDGALGDRAVTLRIGDLPACRGDSLLLKQVFVNLFSNALKFSRGRDEAVIEVGWRPGAEEPGCSVYFVKDNGAGFDMAYADKLFRIFQRLHSAEEFEGNGVGLAIVHRIVRRHGGRVWAEGAVGKGATFFFTLPRDDEPWAAVVAGSAEAPDGSSLLSAG